MKELLLVVALLVAIAWLVVRIRRGAAEARAAKAPRKPSLRATSPFHAVSVMYSSTACDAAKALAGRRFLAGTAPRLPLPECDAAECRCRFSHHSDRRSGGDRRSPFSPSTYAGQTGSHAIERRDRRDRRRSRDAVNF